MRDVVPPSGRFRRSHVYALLALCVIGLLSSGGARAQDVCSSASDWCAVLSDLCVTNGCAGNTGDYYDNRDNGHTSLPGSEEHPQLTLMSSGYGGQGLEWNHPTLAGKVIVGNASVAYVSGPNWGSVTRYLFMLNQAGPLRSYGHYTNNIAYWHPCHLDHPGYRDFYHAMLPTINNSQGSSGSEMWEVKKWIIALAALRPLVKQRLKDAGLLMPTLQMIARRARVGSDEAHLTAEAHPSVFDGSPDFHTMTGLANSITPGDLPPAVRIRTVSDNYGGGNPYIYDFDGSNRRLFDTPVSIARVFKDHDYTKWMIVSAEDSFDSNSRSLTYHWSVLRGDPAHVRISPQNGPGSVVRIEIDYQPEPTIGSRQSSMVVIGAFVRNGVHYSAPAFVTSVMTGQDRQYETGTNRLLQIDYIDEYRIHPQIAHRKTWTSDIFVYESRNPAGWVRDGAWEFTRNGLFAAVKDVNDNILEVQELQHTLQDAGDHQKVAWSPFGSTFPYDPIPPAASFITPSQDDRLSGTVTISADAQDNVGVTFVSVWDGDTYLRGFSQPPFSFPWNTTLVADGPHNLRVLAYDRNRNITESTIRVIVRNRSHAGDFDGDGFSDKAVFRPGSGTWYVHRSDGTGQLIRQWGVAGDVPVPGDYGGDFRSDFAVWRPSNGTWYVQTSEGTMLPSQVYGTAGDIPVPGNYGGDERTDYALFRPSTGAWFILTAEGTQLPVTYWGLSTSTPTPGDFDGDGYTDIAVFHNGTWHVIYSSGSTFSIPYGLPSDLPRVADFSGDGRADFGLFRPSNGTWFVLRSDTLTGLPPVTWGLSSDASLPADVAGDNRADYLVWRPANGTWYALSAEGTMPPPLPYGAPGDIPIAR